MDQSSNLSERSGDNTEQSEAAAHNTTDKKLHIAMFIDAYTPMRNGTVESTRRFTEGLRQRGHRVTIVTTGEVAADKVIVPTIRLPYFTNHIILPMQMNLARPTMATVAPYLKDVDVIHLQLPFYMGWWAARYAKAHDIACVATHHVQAEWLSNAGIRWQGAIAFCYRLFIKIYHKAHYLICPSQLGLNDLARYGYNGKGVVISNGVTDMFHRQDPLPEDDMLEKKDPVMWTVLSVGRLAVEKFHDVTIKAIAKSRYAGRIQLIIAGAGPQRKKLEQLSAQLPNPVQFILKKPEALVTYYNRCDLFAHSAHTEMEGMACLEAIACGAVPVIADSHLSASSVFSLDERSLYIFADPQSLADKIDYWIEHPQQRDEMKPRYAEHAQQFRFDQSLDLLEQTYYQALTQPAATEDVPSNPDK